MIRRTFSFFTATRKSAPLAWRCVRMAIAGLVIGLALGASRAFADDGYRLWLRYDRIADESLRTADAAALSHLVLATPDGTDSPTLTAARNELTAGLKGLLGLDAKIDLAKSTDLPAA